MSDMAPENWRTLFDGTDLAAWTRRDGKPARWPVQPDGSVLTRGGDIVTRQLFGDCELHLEFRIPSSCFFLPRQWKGNSGVYLMGRYEIQVLDAFGLSRPLRDNDCAAVYQLRPPDTNAAQPPGTWQSYDITFRAPRFDNTGRKTEPARLTLLWNGVSVHQNIDLPAPTPGGIAQTEAATGPLLLQDHFCSVRFRNVRMRKQGDGRLY